MIWELIVWSIFLFFFLSAVIVVHYWYDLMRSRDQYRREELIDFQRIIQDRFFDLMGRGDTAMNYAGLATGIGLAWFLTMLGGLFSPGHPSIPDHATDQIPNYFFQSALFPIILHIVWPSLRDIAEQQGGPFARLVAAEHAFFIGLAVALSAIYVAVWGVFHDVSFLWNLLNLGACLGYAGYRVDLALRQSMDIDESYADDVEESDYRGPGDDLDEKL